MSDPLHQLVHHLNHNLTELGVDLKVDVETMVFVCLDISPLEHETYLRVRITKQGWELVNPEAQTRRIEREIRERFQEPGSEVETSE